MIKRYGLRDDQWQRIEHLLPGKPGDPGATAKDNRLFVEAVLYRYRAGIPWRDLIENLFQKLKQYRAISTRYDKTVRNFLGAIHLAATVVWLN